MNAQNPLTVYNNIVGTIQTLSMYEAIKSIYIVGVHYVNQ